MSFTHIRFKNKETKETAYLLDRVLGLGSHARMSDGVKAGLLEEAVQTGYEKAGQSVCPGESVTKETVMHQVREKDIPVGNEEVPAKKKTVKYLYVEADEDHIALQFNEKNEI